MARAAAPLAGEGVTSAEPGGVDAGRAPAAPVGKAGGVEGRRDVGAGVEVADDAGRDGGREALAGSGVARGVPATEGDTAGTGAPPGTADASLGGATDALRVPSAGSDALGSEARGVAVGEVEGFSGGASGRTDPEGARADARSALFGAMELPDGEAPGAVEGVAFFSGPGAAAPSEGDPSLGERTG